MRFELTQTASGPTVFDREAGECFKSRHNAWLEAEEVFFRPGVAENPWFGKAAPFRVLELGFGLGTNFLFLAERAAALELVSVDKDLAGAGFFLEQEPASALQEILRTKAYRHGPFSARLLEGDFFSVLPGLKAEGESFHCIYFDPFSPKANPEEWSARLFALAASLLAPGGRLVTYSVSRAAKDGAEAAGLRVEKRDLPPALRKRSSLLASKAGGP
jgi:tRNA U34 5-methylaminomethyl-2-thiouridine-forming methyltransferase MnmC